MSHSYLIVPKVNQAWSTLFDTQNAYHPIYTYIYIYFSARQLLIKFRHVKIRGPWRWTRDASLCSRSANVPWTGGGRIAPRKSNKITCLLTIGPFYVPRSLFAASYVVWHVVAGRGGGMDDSSHGRQQRSTLPAADFTLSYQPTTRCIERAPCSAHMCTTRTTQLRDFMRSQSVTLV